MAWSSISLIIWICCIAFAAPYHFVTEPTNNVVLIGQQVRIQCAVEGLQMGLPMMWLNQSSVIGMNDQFFSDNPRATLEGSTHGDIREYTFTIAEAELMDEGEYECQIPGAAPKKQLHHVMVNIAPSMMVDETDIETELNETVMLRCEADGKPEPTVQWTREGNTLPSGENVFEGEVLQLDDVGKRDGGIYTCTASNGYGDPVSETIEVNVYYAPEVVIEEEVIHTGPGEDVFVKCTFDSNPSVQVSWMHNGSDVNTNSRQNIKVWDSVEESTQATVSTLRIQDVRNEDVGMYKCKGGNAEGAVAAEALVTGLPHKLVIHSKPQGTYSDQFHLEWQVESVPEVVEFYLTLIQQNDTVAVMLGNNTVPAAPGNRRHHTHRQDYTFSDLSKDTTYTVHLMARNTFGVGPVKIFDFSTSQEENIAPPPTSAPTPAPKVTEKQDIYHENEISDATVEEQFVDTEEGGHRQEIQTTVAFTTSENDETVQYQLVTETQVPGAATCLLPWLPQLLIISTVWLFWV